MPDRSDLDALPIRPIHRREYEQMVELGWLDDERVELLDGRLVRMNAQGPMHVALTDAIADALRAAFGARARVRTHAPLALGERSAPEPDIAVVAPGRYRDAHPTTAWLVVEVTRSSGGRDRVIKDRIYARGAIPEYWIVDPSAGTIEVRTEPGPSGYRRSTVHRAGVLAAVTLSGASIDLDELFA